MLAELPRVSRQVESLLARLTPHCTRLHPGARVLDLGSAQGKHVAVLALAGFDAMGIEPWQEAVDASPELARRTGAEFNVVQGEGEDIPCDDESFDFVLCFSTVEHVADPPRVYREVLRVLRPDGGFFLTTNNTCSPRQNEIKGFPLFPWYPRKTKRRLALWAAENHPRLVGYSPTPAINWYSRRTLSHDLRNSGFTRIVDHWQLKRAEELAGRRRVIFEAVQRREPLRRAGDLFVPTLSVLAIK